jgi:hypothetical protein
MRSIGSKSTGALWLVAALVAAAPAQRAVAQSLLCATIRPGEDAEHAAQRITGAARNTREPWFQILDATSRVVPKADYASARAGWYACVATGLTDVATPTTNSETSTLAHRFRAGYLDVVRLFQSPDPNIALWFVLLALIAIATHNADQYFRDREQILKTMQQFSRKFVYEFERPLAAGALSPRPIQSRLRFAPHASRLDILLAPGAGRRYPNLSDHRRNVEYDVQRVLNVLRDEPFVVGRPRMDGRWVVLPFQLKSAITQAGGR